MSKINSSTQLPTLKEFLNDWQPKSPFIPEKALLENDITNLENQNNTQKDNYYKQNQDITNNQKNNLTEKEVNMTTTPIPAQLPEGMTEAQFLDGINYARNNWQNENASHLHVDKKLIREKFDLNGKKVLDFGCGMGGMTLWYATNWDCTVHGVDIDGHHIAVAKILQQQEGIKNIKFEKRDVLAAPLTEKYDMVFMNDVAEHIPLPILAQIMEQLGRSLTQSGKIFVTYPPWRSPYASHVNHVIRIPWVQFLPKKMVMNMIEDKNHPLVGEEESDLKAAYLGLNHLDHEKIMQIVENANLKVAYRKSHTILNRLGGSTLKNVNLNLGPLSFLVTKEFLLLENK